MWKKKFHERVGPNFYHLLYDPKTGFRCTFGQFGEGVLRKIHFCLHPFQPKTTIFGLLRDCFWPKRWIWRPFSSYNPKFQPKCGSQKSYNFWSNRPHPTLVNESGLFLTLGSGTYSSPIKNLTPLLNTNIPLISGKYGLRNHFWPLESRFLMRKS